MTEITFRSDMGVELVDHMGTDETVARAARVSTGKDQLEQGKIEGLIGYLMRESHSSPFEHATITVRVEVPIFVHRQIMTHRTLSKNSESGRYTEFKPVFYAPSKERPLVNAGSGAHPDIQEGSEDQGRIVSDLHQAVPYVAWDSYTGMIQTGVASEVARNVLPVTVYTSAYLTGNLLGWFNFLRLRAGYEGHPQYEIVKVAKKVEAIIADLYPLSYKAWRATLEP